jgi:sugar phosphate isomerase/epimerase
MSLDDGVPAPHPSPDSDASPTDTPSESRSGSPGDLTKRADPTDRAEFTGLAGLTELTERPVRPVAEPAVRGTRTAVGLSTASVYPHTCAEAFGIAADLGYDGVEVMVWTDPVSQDVAALQRLSEHYGIPVLAIHAPTLLVTQRVWGKEPWPKLERSCEMAAQLGARTVVAHPPFRWQREYASTFAEGVDRITEQFDIALAIENMYPWRARQREVLAYLPGWDPVPQPYRHVTLDLSHSATAGVSGLEVAAALGDRLAHLHLADGSGSAKDEHLVPGRGSQPCGEVLGLLAERDWPGTVVVEVNTRRARSRSNREADLAESLAFARLHLAAAAHGAAQGAAGAR